ncbi:MAG: class II aldolase/adducin family protein [Dehalococcoidia bacterium]|nr:class II aldolase/adducin family protein [Dehalococcoidia bacterium]
MRKHPWDDAREAVLATALGTVRLGLVVGTSGNVSVRLDQRGGDLLAITPSGRLYSTLDSADILVCGFDGGMVQGELPPSTELPTHVAIYRARPDVRAVVHTHSLYATVAALAAPEIPPIVDEMVVAVGGAVKVADYGFPGTEELGAKVVAALGQRSAVLLQNHGLVAVGISLQDALAVAELVERMAHIFIIARLLGPVHPLAAEVVEQEAQIYRQRHSL